MESNTTNMDVASNPPNHPSDISHISETQMTPIDTSKIKTEPSNKFNLSSDIIVIDSDSEDSIVNLLPETPSSSTEKTITPSNTENVAETPPSVPLMMTKTMTLNSIQVIKSLNILPQNLILRSESISNWN